jgi:hypothetical protein
MQHSSLLCARIHHLQISGARAPWKAAELRVRECPLCHERRPRSDSCAGEEVRPPARGRRAAFTPTCAATVCQNARHAERHRSARPLGGLRAGFCGLRKSAY